MSGTLVPARGVEGVWLDVAMRLWEKYAPGKRGHFLVMRGALVTRSSVATCCGRVQNQYGV